MDRLVVRLSCSSAKKKTRRKEGRTHHRLRRLVGLKIVRGLLLRGRGSRLVPFPLLGDLVIIVRLPARGVHALHPRVAAVVAALLHNHRGRGGPVPRTLLGSLIVEIGPSRFGVYACASCQSERSGAVRRRRTHDALSHLVVQPRCPWRRARRRSPRRWVLPILWGRSTTSPSSRCWRNIPCFFTARRVEAECTASRSDCR